MIAILAFPMISTHAFADSPCKDKRDAKRAAHKAAHECMSSWERDVRPTDTDPSDDCSSKVSAFVQSSKDLKGCLVDHQKKK
jgi:hypothetical protein